MRQERPRAILFDWDGTLVDSAEASYKCYVHALARFGIAYERSDFEKTYSPDWYRTYRAMGLPESLWLEADECWLEHYREERADLIPGAREALLRLRQAGRVLGVVTGGDKGRVTGEIEEWRLAPVFSTLVGAGDTVERKPRPEALLLGLARLGVPPESAAYVGDSPEDIEMAQAAGVYSVGIPGGFPNRAALEASRPDLLVRNLDEAVEALLARVTPGG